MTPGLPGFGLGRVFFIISALLAPFGELVLTMRGRSSRARWASVGRQLLIAVAMICAVGALLGFVGLVSGVGPVQGLASFSLLPLIATAGLLAFILVTAKLVQLLLRGGRRGRREFRTPNPTHPFQAQRAVRRDRSQLSSQRS